MAKSASSPRPLPKAPPRPLQKPSEKTGAKAGPAPVGKPQAKPADPKAAKPTDAKAALPDAALLDDEAADGNESGTPAASGIAAWLAWLPAGRKRWIVLGSGAGGLMAMIAAATFAAASHFRAPPPPPAPTTISGPAAAVDGATVTIGGRTVHLEAVDAPPASLICRDGAWTYNCGAQARRALDEAIAKAPVDCENLRSRPDGRVTALCRNDAGLDLAAIQVESGWAVNDMRTSSRYIAEESRAEAAGSGLWRNDFAHPELWHDQATQSTAPQNAASRPR